MPQTILSDNFDDMLNDAAHAAVERLEAAGLVIPAAGRGDFLYALNDAIDALVAPLVQVVEEGVEMVASPVDQAVGEIVEGSQW